MKPIKAKPIFYTVCYEALKNIAREHGFNLLIDGSLNRDLDLVLIPWIDNHTEPSTVILAFNGFLGGRISTEKEGQIITNMLNGAGRKKAIIQLNRDSRFDMTYGSLDEEWYLDITVII